MEREKNKITLLLCRRQSTDPQEGPVYAMKTLKTVMLAIVFMVHAESGFSSEGQKQASVRLLVTKKGLDYSEFGLQWSWLANFLYDRESF